VCSRGREVRRMMSRLEETQRDAPPLGLAVATASAGRAGNLNRGKSSCRVVKLRGSLQTTPGTGGRMPKNGSGGSYAGGEGREPRDKKYPSSHTMSR